MFVSMFDVRVESVDFNDLSVSLRIKDGRGNTVTLFFDDAIGVQEFSRDVRQTVLNETDKRWAEFNKPNLITDKKDGGSK